MFFSSLRNNPKNTDKELVASGKLRKRNHIVGKYSDLQTYKWEDFPGSPRPIRSWKRYRRFQWKVRNMVFPGPGQPITV